MPRPRRAALPALLLSFAALLLAAWFAREPILRFFITYPDIGQPPVKADAILVLAGGWRGERVLKAGELVRDGYAPYALLSSPSGWYEIPECEAARSFAVRRGFPASSFVCVPVQSNSTREEADEITPHLRQRGIRRLLLVSVSTHLRRATVLFREAAPGITVIPVAAPPRHYDLQHWWRDREGRKDVFLEWTKLLTAPLGL